MKLINILRYIKGYVKITVSGGFRERFINLCNVQGVRLWNVVPDIDKIHAFVSIKGFHRLRSIARESGVRIKIEKKSGVPLFLKKHRNRAVLMAGILLIAFFYTVMNQFIWFIEVEGTQKISHEEIIIAIERYGVKIGAYAPGIDGVYAGRSIINDFDGRLLWVSVNVKGSKAIIEVRDYVGAREDTTFGEPCNIIADFEGTILSIEPVNGDIEASPGSAVKKGDLLISGVIQNRDMSASYLEARGKITAHHNVQFKRSYQKKQKFSYYTDVKEYVRPTIIGFEIPSPADENGESFSFSEHIILRDNKLPFGAVYNTTAKKYAKDDDYVLIRGIDAYITDYYRTFANTNILECKMQVEISRGSYLITADMSCIDFMGVKSEIYVEE